MLRLCLLCTLLTAGSALAGNGVTVPVDVGIGPAGYWFYGRLLENRGAVPHFGLMLNVHAIINKETIEANWNRIPDKYKGMAKNVTEARIGPSIFIPSALIISPKLDALNGVGMYGVSWTPFGLTLVSTGQSSSREWNQTRGRFFLNADLLLTFLVIHSDLEAIPLTFFFRPGLQLTAEIQLLVSKTFLLGLGGGGQVYIPQQLGSFFEFNDFSKMIWLTGFAFLKLHFRFPYEIAL